MWPMAMVPAPAPPRSVVEAAETAAAPAARTAVAKAEATAVRTTVEATKLARRDRPWRQKIDAEATAAAARTAAARSAVKAEAEAAAAARSAAARSAAARSMAVKTAETNVSPCGAVRDVLAQNCTLLLQSQAGCRLEET